MLKAIFCTLLLFNVELVFSQLKDQDGFLRQSLMWSMVPGGGQLFNQIQANQKLEQKHHSWWKLPAIYGAFGTLGYFAAQNYQEARLRKLEWRQRLNPSVNAENPYKNRFLHVETVTLQSEYRDYSLRRNIMLAGMLGVYLITIAEAYLSGLNIQRKIMDQSRLSFTPILIGTNNPALKLSWSLD